MEWLNNLFGNNGEEQNNNNIQYSRKEVLSFEFMDPLSETTGDPTMAQQKVINYGMSLSNQVNMTNCYKHCEHFFKKCTSIHFNVLIAYWMMAGYLGPFDSIEEAYKKGHQILLDLTFGEDSMLKTSDQDPEMIEFKESTESKSRVCGGHRGLCDLETLEFGDLVDLEKLENFVVLADGMLKSVPKVIEDQSPGSDGATDKKLKQSMLLIHGSNLSREVFHTPRKLRFVAYFNPRPESLNLLLNNVSKQLSVLILRDCELLQEIDIPLEKFTKLTVLEISGLSQVQKTESLLQKISELSQLKCLHLSGLLIERLPEDMFEKLIQLHWVILRGCPNLLILPSVRNLLDLKMLDVSYSSALQKSATAVLGNPELQMLDFSYTSVTNLPTTQKTRKLTHVVAMDVKVSVLSCLRQVNSIEVLDLSGAKKVKQIKQLEGNTNLTVLNLSRTDIDSVDFLSKLVNLRDLILRQCTKLKKLSSVGDLTKLEVFDVWGCEILKELPEGLEELETLKEINLSLTSVSHLPSFAKLTNLVKLSLRGLEVDSLEGLENHSNMKELDLNSLKIVPPQELKFDFLEKHVKLQILDLSNTVVAQLPQISKLVNLKELLLANCPDLEADLHSLANLETLDLSLPDSSTVSNGKDIKVPSTLRKLVLKNRSGVNKLFPVTSVGELGSVEKKVGELGYLDLRGTDLDRIPYEIMAQVNCILLPEKIALSGACLSRMGEAVPGKIDWEDENSGNVQGKFSDASEIQIVSVNGNRSSMSTPDAQFFQLSEGSWEAFIHQFSVFLPQKEHPDKIIHLDGDDFILRGGRSWARRLLNLELKGSSIEIHGFSELPVKKSELPDNIQKVLDSAENVALVGNTFQVRCNDENDVAPDSNEVSDAASGSNKNKEDAPTSNEPTFSICFKAMKVCCIRNCQEMESVLTTEKEKNGVIAGSLERLVLSNLVKLKKICGTGVTSETTESLKHLHIDCCPELKNVITASQVPENLESLNVKFCDKMKSLFVFEQNTSLNNLQKLILFELPELETIGAEFPNLKSLEIGKCPKLKSLDGVIESACASLTRLHLDSFAELESIESKLPKLETLIIGKCPKLKSLDEVIESASASLSRIHLDSLPCLVHALPSSPELKKLGEVKISSCNGIVTLFSAASSSSSKKLNLQTLKLRNLPKLESIGAELFLASAPDLDPRLPANVKHQIIFRALP